MESPLIVREDSRVVKVLGYKTLGKGHLEEGALEARTEARTGLSGRLTDHDSQHQGEPHQYHADPKQGK